MILETERLILRPWQEEDAEALYKYASDPQVGPIAGWPPHKNTEESLAVIRTVFKGREYYAICLKGDSSPCGCIELKLKGNTDMTSSDTECELGYWLGRPFWHQGIMTEAAEALIRHGFENLFMEKIWCGYYEGNFRSQGLQEKLGFRFQWKSENVNVPLMNEKRTGYVSSITKDEWIWHKMHSAALAVQNDRKLSEYIQAGSVAAAVLSASGKIYTGVCVDTSCTLGICAERNAIFNMITNGEQEIKKVLAVMPEGGNGAPCGACRELMVQLMPETYKQIEIMLDYENFRVVTLGEITPEWWI